MFGGGQPHFVFLPTGAAEKLLVSENRLASGFQGRVGGLAGVECSPKILWIFGERHARQESGDFVDTLNGGAENAPPLRIY